MYQILFYFCSLTHNNKANPFLKQTNPICTMIKALRVILVFLALSAIGFVGYRYYTRYTAPSPPATAIFDNGTFKVSVDYCQPSKRGRLIFGTETEHALVPYGKWWRTGANEATIISFSKDVLIAGKPLKAGSYTLFTTPQQQDWLVMINSETGQWGLSYNKDKDVLEVPVKSVIKADSEDKFTIDFVEQAKGTTMLLRWDSTEVIIPIVSL